MDVLCAYLRMPVDDDGPAEERQVRRTAQYLLAKHLSGHEHFWPHMNLDLSGATLVGFHLLSCRVDFADFSRARFTGRPASFYLAVYADGVEFRDARSTEPPSFLPPGWRAVPGEEGGIGGSWNQTP